MLAQASIPGSTLWPLLLGSAITLVSTLVAQWSSLSYQTRQQRSARRADFQRTTLIELRDVLAELDNSRVRVQRTKKEALQTTGRYQLPTSHPDMEAVWAASARIHLLATGLDELSLRLDIQSVARSAWSIAKAATVEDAEKELVKLRDLFNAAVQQLGEQLRSLP